MEDYPQAGLYAIGCTILHLQGLDHFHVVVTLQIFRFLEMFVKSMINLVPGSSLGLKLILILGGLLLLELVLIIRLVGGFTGLLGRPLLKIIK